MVITAAWTAITLVGWPPAIPQRVPWTGVIFAVAAFVSFVSLLRENLELKNPHLQIVYNPATSPYVHDKAGIDNATLRIFRVGLRNTGRSALGVRLKVIDFSPQEPTAAYIGHELWVMGQPEGTMSADVHRGDTPLVFFDVIGQLFQENAPSYHLHVRFASPGLYARPLSGQDSYKLTLAIDASGASPPVTFAVEKDKSGKRWEMRRL